MRRLLFGAALLAALPLLGAVAGCEDGPTQTFQPAPGNAGDNWNNGNTPGVTDTATTGFDTQGGGTNKIEKCTGPVKAMKWATMVTQPIVPPAKAAGIDMSGGASWQGLTVEQAEDTNCQSDAQGDRFGNGNLVNSWGDNGEVWVEYKISTRKVQFMTLWPGYVGTADFKSRDGMHTYQIAITKPVIRDGKTMVLDWVGNNGKNFVAPADELYRALTATFAPAFPVDQIGVTCFDTGRCIKGSFGDVAYFYIPALGFALWIDNQHANQPVPSIPTRLDVFPAKTMPFAFAAVTMKLDAEGPRADAGKLGIAKNPCVLKMGLTYADFLADCVRVTGDKTKDDTESNKLTGGLSHGTERFSFDVSGVDINFTDNNLKADGIVLDTDTPQANDTSTYFSVDQATLGRVANDYDNNGVLDLHGAGAVYKEFARLVRANLLAYRNQPDGDTSKCLFPPGWSNDPNFKPEDFIANLPAWCTGFEGFITAAPPAKLSDPVNVGATQAVALLSTLKLGLKLGHQKSLFCMDATGDFANDYQACAAPYGAQGDIFPTSYAVALKIFGKGKLQNMPTEVQDVRFFFRMWMQALAKYFTVGDQNPVPDISKIVLDSDDFFFDSVGSGQFEIAEFVDRRFASKAQDPTDLVFVADVRNGIMSSYDFSRDIFRGETAIYAAMLENQNDGIGQESTALLTNTFGSPVLSDAYPAMSMKGKTAFYCATHLDAANCDGKTPPLDANGNMLLDDFGRPMLNSYPGAMAGAQTAFTLGTTPIKVLKTYPNIQQAMVRVPTHADPYNQKSKGLALIDILVPWLPKQPGEGFPIAINGSQDKWIETAQLDFSGTTITANVDYDAVIDPMTHMPDKTGTIQFLAVETTDFLGQVFLCQDAGTGDLLTARMYTPASNILDWIKNHPSAVDACGLVVRFSPFNNFPDYITSLNGGVRLGITQGGGLGRVVDVTLFVPGQ